MTLSVTSAAGQTATIDVEVSLFATTLAHNDVDLDTIRRKMRHSNISTTLKCYIEADPERLAHADSVIESALFG